METNCTITLADGRTLGFAEYGAPSGFPICYFHGGQESRLSSAFMDGVATQLGIRIIAPDRPGIGLSSFQPGRQFRHWGNDVAELANQLGLAEYSVLGLSGGAPHVLASVVADQPHIQRASIVSGAAPYHYKGSLKGMWFPVKLIHWFASWSNDRQLRKIIRDDFDGLVKAPEKRLKQFQKYLPKPDKALMTRQPQYGWEFIEGSKESYRQGIDGVVQEWQLYVGDWQMDLSTIDFPVRLWYGTDDKMAPPSRGKYYESNLRNAQLTVLPNEGHFSLIRNHLHDILIALMPAEGH